MTPTAFLFALAANGLTQREFARFCGLHWNSVAKWVAGTRPIPGWVPVMLGLMEQAKKK